MSIDEGCFVLDDHNQPHAVSYLEMSLWMGRNAARCRVVLDELPGGAEVSTVFLGQDHGSSLRDAGAPPILFETRVMSGPLLGMTHRYTSWEEALAGHQEMVARAREAGTGDKKARREDDA
jgi:hypothetical protein